MEPESSAADQKQQCIFCQLIAGKVASRKVYEDADCLGVLDINPASRGHVLLMPKEHYPLLPLAPEEVVGKLFVAAQQISQAMLKGLKAEGTTIFIANGTAAGQKAQHLLVHIIPRMPGDGLTFTVPSKQMTPADMQAVKKRIGVRLGELMGRAYKEEKQPPAQEIAAKEPVKETKRQEAKPADPKLDLDAIARLLDG